MTDPKPGYYWARWKASRPTGGWHPIEYTDEGAGWTVWQCGSDVATSLDDWELGPRLEPPEEEK